MVERWLIEDGGNRLEGSFSFYDAVIIDCMMKFVWLTILFADGFIIFFFGFFFFLFFFLFTL